jgi:hypothetical protein
VSRFLQDAGEIFDAASHAADDGSGALTILIHAQGQIHIVNGSESPIDSLQAQHGCSTAYRVTRGSGQVRVEGRNGSSRCVLEDSKPKRRVETPAAVLGLFSDRPLYSIAGALASR